MKIKVELKFPIHLYVIQDIFNILICYPKFIPAFGTKLFTEKVQKSVRQMQVSARYLVCCVNLL